jgi:hypothetical protein
MYDIVPSNMNAGAAQTWFVVGAIVCMAAGGLHALATLLDVVRPTFFAPIESSVKPSMEATGMRFRGMFPGDSDAPSMWSFWLGFNISHGLGAFTFGLLCLLIAAHDFQLVERIDAMRPLTIAIPAAYVALAFRFWFYVPAAAAGSATACFTIAAVLSA